MQPVRLSRRGLLAGTGAPVVARRARAQAPAIRIGVLTALSGEYTDAAGMGSVLATRMAVDDFMAANKPGFKVEILQGDMQDKPDIGMTITRQWFDLGKIVIQIASEC